MQESAGSLYFVSKSAPEETAPAINVTPGILQRIYSALSVFAIIAFFLVVFSFIALLSTTFTVGKYTAALAILTDLLK